MHQSVADKLLMSYQLMGVLLANLLSWIDGKGLLDALLKGVAWALGGLIVSLIYNHFKNKKNQSIKEKDENS